MEYTRVKVVVHIPKGHGDSIRTAIAKAGGGIIGEYTYCSFSIEGMGRSMPSDIAHPTIGKAGQLTVAREERVEVTVDKDDVKAVCRAIREVHPYEEPTIDLYPLINENQL